MRLVESLLFIVKLVALCLITTTTPVQGQSQQQQQQQRHLLVTIPFTQQGVDPILQANLGYSHAAAALLALDHYATHNASVVTQLPRLAAQCNITWNVSIANSHSTGFGSTTALMLTNSALQQQQSAVDAVIGGYQYGEQPALQLTTVANTLTIPSVMYGGSDLTVVEHDLFPFSARVHPDALALGEPLVNYLYQVLNRTNFYAMVSPAFSEVAQETQQVLQDAAMQRNVFVQAVTYQPNSYIPGPNASIALQVVKQMGYRTILLILDDWDAELDQIADAAETLLMNTPDYFWVLVGNVNLQYFDTPNLSPTVQQLLHGALYVQPLETFGWVDEDPFLQAWQSQAPAFVERVNALVQTEAGGVTIQQGSKYFQQQTPAPGTGFCYDAVMTVLLGACQAQMQGAKQRGTNNHNDTLLLQTTQEEAQQIQALSFQGSSGLVQFNVSEIYPGGRAGFTVPFGAYNLLLPTLVNNNGTRATASTSMTNTTDSAPPLATTLTAVRKGAMNSTVQIPWTIMSPFVFASNSVTPPPLINTPNGNYLTRAVRICGFLLFSLAIVFIFSCGLWVVYYRNTSVVRAAQPIFLLALLVGSTMIAIAIVINAYDESYGWTDKQLSTSCTATPWLIICGFQVIYSSLWLKLWRINKVLQFKRRAVPVCSVLWPAAALFVAVIILLTTWTALGGFQWVRTVLNPATGESAARCYTQNGVAFFVPIALLMSIPILLTLIMSWKTKDIAAEYSEGSWLLALIVFQLQLVLISIPIFVLIQGTENSVRYVVQSAVFFLFAISSAGFICLPKMWAHHFPDTKTQQVRGARNGVTVSGVAANMTTTTASNDPTISHSYVPSSSLLSPADASHRNSSQLAVPPGGGGGGGSSSSANQHDGPEHS